MDVAHILIGCEGRRERLRVSTQDLRAASLEAAVLVLLSVAAAWLAAGPAAAEVEMRAPTAGGAALPADLAAAQSYYDAGDFAAAAEAARAEDSADAFALAARALMAQAMLTEDPDEAVRLARRAQQTADRALDLAPDHVEANLQYAAALGLRGVHMSGIRAYVKRMAPRGRKHLDAALAADPDNPWAQSLLGAWHMEVVRRGGGGVYGADFDQGVALYERALQTDPDNVIIAYNFAAALLAADGVDENPALQAALNAALTGAMTGESWDAFSAELKMRARALAEALEAGGGIAATAKGPAGG